MSQSKSPVAGTWNDGQQSADEPSRLGEHVDHFKEHLSAAGQDAANAARSGLTAAQQAACRSMDSAKRQGQEAMSAVSKKVSDNPMVSLGVAAGVGLLVGLLIFRRRS